MILNVASGGRRWCAETDAEISAVVAEVISSLRGWDRESEWVSPGTNAWFSWSDHRIVDPADMPTNTLIVSLNKETGYGGLIWFVTAEYPGAEEDEVLANIWVSDNPHPPSGETEVVAEPGEPYFFESRSVLLIDEVKAALDEFCRVRTGMRPECVQWTPGEVSGRRADREEEEVLHDF
ncbi:Imm1 family immunity protein [Streptomyces sp. NPDC005017]|uniref:Imm1 family immunity protein n=1 Tax=Streptomyces sp. NPDC005017 TaxID=3364706 RepID=UPI0036BCF746